MNILGLMFNAESHIAVLLFLHHVVAPGVGETLRMRPLGNSHAFLMEQILGEGILFPHTLQKQHRQHHQGKLWESAH